MNTNCAGGTNGYAAFLQGTFDPTASTSWDKTGNVSIFQSDAGFNATGNVTGATVNLGGDTVGTDVLHVNATTSLSNFPLDIIHTSSFGRNALGVGYNSTLLSTLYNAKTIASQVWSFWWGLYGTEAIHQMDGSLILGGYDAAKTIGEPFVQDLNRDSTCVTGVVVSVTDIVMNQPNGTTNSIIGSSRGSGKSMCIEPTYGLLAMTQDIWQTFVDNAGGTNVGPSSTGINTYGLVYFANGSFQGNLTYTL